MLLANFCFWWLHIANMRQTCPRSQMVSSQRWQCLWQRGFYWLTDKEQAHLHCCNYLANDLSSKNELRECLSLRKRSTNHGTPVERFRESKKVKLFSSLLTTYLHCRRSLVPPTWPPPLQHVAGVIVLIRSRLDQSLAQPQRDTSFDQIPPAPDIDEVCTREPKSNPPLKCRAPTDVPPQLLSCPGFFFSQKFMLSIPADKVRTCVWYLSRAKVETEPF